MRAFSSRPERDRPLHRDLQERRSEAEGSAEPLATLSASIQDVFGNTVLQGSLAGELEGIGLVIHEAMSLGVAGVHTASHVGGLLSNGFINDWMDRNGAGGDPFGPSAEGVAIAAKSTSGGASGEVLPAGGDPRMRVIGQGGGAPLPESVRTRMEAALGHPFAHVRVHTGSVVGAAAAVLNARAFAIGSDLYFGEGEFAPGTPAGDHILAHELAHVVQADEGRLPRPSGPGLEVSSPTDSFEVEAERIADALSAGLVAGPATDVVQAPVAEAGLVARETDGSKNASDTNTEHTEETTTEGNEVSWRLHMSTRPGALVPGAIVGFEVQAVTVGAGSEGFLFQADFFLEEPVAWYAARATSKTLSDVTLTKGATARHSWQLEAEGEHRVTCYLSWTKDGKNYNFSDRTAKLAVPFTVVPVQAALDGAEANTDNVDIPYEDYEAFVKGANQAATDKVVQEDTPGPCGKKPDTSQTPAKTLQSRTDSQLKGLEDLQGQKTHLEVDFFELGTATSTQVTGLLLGSVAQTRLADQVEVVTYTLLDQTGRDTSSASKPYGPRTSEKAAGAEKVVSALIDEWLLETEFPPGWLLVHLPVTLLGAGATEEKVLRFEIENSTPLGDAGDALAKTSGATGLAGLVLTLLAMSGVGTVPAGVIAGVMVVSAGTGVAGAGLTLADRRSRNKPWEAEDNLAVINLVTSFFAGASTLTELKLVGATNATWIVGGTLTGDVTNALVVAEGHIAGLREAVKKGDREALYKEIVASILDAGLATLSIKGDVDAVKALSVKASTGEATVVVVKDGLIPDGKVETTNDHTGVDDTTKNPAKDKDNVKAPSDARTLTDIQARDWYNEQVAGLGVLHSGMLVVYSPKEAARYCHKVRHEARIEARRKMKDQFLAYTLAERDLTLYGTPDGPTFEYMETKAIMLGYTGDAIYDYIVLGSKRTNEQVNSTIDAAKKKPKAFVHPNTLF